MCERAPCDIRPQDHAAIRCDGCTGVGWTPRIADVKKVMQSSLAAVGEWESSLNALH